MKHICFFFLLFINLAGYSQQDNIAIIPQPVSLQKQQGSFVLPEQLIIRTSKNPELQQIATRLAERITLVTGSKVLVNENTGPSNVISLLLSGKSFPKEGYQLSVTPSTITLEAAEPAGIFYGVQTVYIKHGFKVK